MDWSDRERSGNLQVTVKLYATLGRFLPPGAERNAISMDIAEGTTVSSLIEQLKLPPELTHLVLINGSYVEPSARGDRVFREGDEFAVFPPIAGG